jgi:agmatine deiminase
MAFPPRVYDGGALAEARAAWAHVARVIGEFEPVALVVAPADAAAAAAALPGEVSLVEAPLDDAWARDIGPTFVRDPEGRLAAVDWRFNGWGAQAWARWSHDDEVAAVIAAHEGVERHRSDLVNEGGGIEVDGAGTVVITETVQLDPRRNPGLARDDVESRLRATLGVHRVLWLARGLDGDYQEFGTRGHVDLVVKFLSPTRAVFHDQRNPAHPDYAVSRAARALLEAAGYEAIGLRAPARESVDGRRCDWSYVNCYLANDALVLGVYDDEADDAAVATLRTLVPDRRVVTVDARALFALGGGVHCITQQQPR